MKKNNSEKEARNRITRSNIIVAGKFVSMIKSSLGPVGSHKIIVDRDNFLIVTRDGRTIFENMEVAHPIEKLLVELSKSIDEDVGDGTTSSVILTGELLSNALKLIEAGVHPNTIINGYQRAEEKSIEAINDLAIPVEDSMLRQIAFTSLNSKTLDQYKDEFADMVVEAIDMTSKKQGEGASIDAGNVYFERVQGKSTLETELFHVIILESQVVASNMPKSVKNPKIALLDASITIEKMRGDKRIELNVSDSSQIEDMHHSTFDYFEAAADQILKTGANVVLNFRGMDNILTSALADRGVLATTNIRRMDLERLSKVSGARVVNDINALSERDFGEVDRIYQKKLGDFKFLFVDVKGAATILIRGGSRQVIDETYRTLNDAIHTTANALKNKKVIPGGGATETYLSQFIKKNALEVKTKEQLAIKAFADALEVIPITLAHNSGEDPITVITELRRMQEAGKGHHGLDVTKRGIVDAVKEGVIEPLIMKRRIIESATETAQMILRADDYIPRKTRS